MAPSRAKKGPMLPSTDPLPTDLRVPSTDPQLLKVFLSLSRPALLDLATEWCLPENRETCGPYINEDFEENDDECPWTAATSYEELVELYRDELSTRKGSKRELIDRILEGDWRHGISLQQLAMAESRSLLDSSGSRRWGAYEMYNKSTTRSSKKTTTTSPTLKLPKFNPTAFISSIHAQISAVTKAHYHISHPTTHPLILIRISLVDTPYATPIFTPGLLATSKTIILAFPTGAPSFIYIMRPTSASSSRKDFDPESTTLLSFVLKSVGPALSRTGEHFDLRSTSLTTRSLDALLAMRGAGRSNAAGGGWSIFADEQSGTHISSALDVKSTTDKTSSADQIVNSRKRKKQEQEIDSGDKENISLLPVRPQNPNHPFKHSTPTAHLLPSKRTRLSRETAGRFGVSSVPEEENKTALPRFDVNVQDAFPELAALKGLQPRHATNAVAEGDRQLTGVRIAFAGKDVFAGIRQLTEMGVVDAKRVPAWMTGEGNVSGGVVKQGRLKAWDGI